MYISTNADPDTNAPLISSGDGLRHWEIYKGITADGGANWTWTPITSNSTVDNIRPIIADSATGERPLIWLRGTYTTYTNYDLNVVALLPFAPGLNHWKNPGGGDWNTAANWNIAVPNGAGASAYFGVGPTPPSASSTITVSGTRTVGSLTIGHSTFSYNLAPGVGGVLSLNNGAGIPASITTTAGSHNIGVPLSLTTSGVNITTDNSSTLTLAGSINGSGGLSKNGTGALILSGNSTYTGATTINTGTLHVTGSVASTSAINFNNATNGVLRVSSTNALGSATINIASSGGAIGPSTRFELTGNITLPNSIALAPRNNSSVSIQNLSGNNTLSGPINIGVGGTQARIQSDAPAGALTLSGPITTTATSDRFLYLQGAGNGNVTGTISDNASNPAGKVNLIKEGPGTWTLSAANTYTGATTVSAGTLIIGQSSRTSSSLSVANGAKAAMTPNGNNTLQVNALTIGSTGALDLADNDLVVNSGNFNTIWNLVIQGVGNTTGITSSSSDGSQILALFDNALVGSSTWNGAPIAPVAVVGKYTYFGDMNIDGQVTGDDYTVIDANLNTTPATGLEWLSGDANLDGIVTGDDYTVIDANLGLGAGSPLAPSRIETTVPEPTALGTMLLAGALLARRRTR